MRPNKQFRRDYSRVYGYIRRHGIEARNPFIGELGLKYMFELVRKEIFISEQRNQLKKWYDTTYNGEEAI